MPVVSRLQSLLNHGNLTIVAPDHGHVKKRVLVHKAECLENVVKLTLGVRFSIPVGVALAKLHVPVEHT
jgi:DhnA family fructose-bisphosphate aldolase class Ia